MKLTIIILALSILTLTSSHKPIESAKSLTSVVSACKYGQCSATAKSTKQRCKSCCQKGSAYCYSHKP